MLRDRTANLLIVSNDAFCDGIRHDAGTDAYLRVLGELHVILAKEADAAVECAFGLPRLARGAIPGILPGALSGDLREKPRAALRYNGGVTAEDFDIVSVPPTDLRIQGTH